MSEFLGARISLISKSDIRYVGILHEINSSDSTVSLENVRSFGTEGRKGDPSEEVAPSDQIYEYIVFRGSDVKDLRIEEGPGAVKENKPPAVPNDPAILGARPHPGSGPGPAAQQGPPGAPPAGPGFGQNPMFYPPPGAPWGRGGPPPGPGGFGAMGYPPPPPNWFPPGQGFPPTGPGPWNNYPYPPGAPNGPPGPPGQNNRQAPGGPAGPGGPQASNQEARPPPIGAGADKQKGPAEMPSEPKVLGQAPPHQANASAPTPPVQSKPTIDEVKATAASLETNGKPGASAQPNKSVPTGPRGARITPAVPLPAALTAKVGQQAMNAAAKQAEGNPAAAAASLRDATQAAKAAVAVAMANLNGPSGAAPAGPQQNGNVMDNLTNKVNEMRVNAARSGVPSNRGRGRGGRQAKIEVPDADFDFASANAKFNKEDLVKEAIAGSPAPETPTESANEAPEMTTGNPPQAYNKTKSFFDNISSEAKERAETGQKPGGREWRGEEQRKNMETFGQGSVDGGYRGYRGRGRGRGGMRGRGYGQGRGRGGYRGPRNDAQQATAEQ